MKILPFLLTATFCLASNSQAAIILVEPNGCSLKDAIRSANADAPRGDCNAGLGADTIITPDVWFETINSTLPTIDTDLTIRTQSSAGQLVISGDDEHRIMRISGVNTDVTLTRVKLTRGNRPSAISDGGAAIRITDASVTINDSVISDNYAVGVNGAGVFIQDGTLVVNNSLFANNIIEFGESPFETHGAGLYAKDSLIQINDSRFFTNLYNLNVPAGSSMYIKGGSLVMKRSLIDEEQDGILADDAIVDIENTTFSRSQINQSAYNDDLLLVRNNSSLSMNHVTFGSYGFVARDSTIDIANSLLGRCSTDNSTWLRDLSNLRFNDRCDADQDGSILIQSLADNGGSTYTHSLNFQSVAINSGDTATCLNEDQRGMPRGEACDVGAYEVNDLADLAVYLQVVTPFPWGTSQTILINLVITNHGPGMASLFDINASANGLTITDVDSLVCSSLPCVYPFISAGSQVVIPVYARLSSFADREFSLVVNAIESSNSLHSDPDNNNNEDTIMGTTSAAADLEVVKTLVTAPPYFVGQSINYAIEVNHLSGLGASNVKVIEMPENLSITNISGCSSVDENVCIIDFIGSISQRNITVNATIDSAFFNNVVTVDADQFDPDTSNNTDNQFNGGATSTADLSVSMALLNDGPHYSDQFVQYAVSINAGPQAATNLVLDSQYQGIYIGIEGCNFLPCEFPAIAANEEINLTFSMFAPQMIPGFLEEVTHSVVLSAGQTDPDLSNNMASISTLLQPAVDLKTNLNLITESPYYVNQEVEYNLQILNRGLNHANDVSVSITNTENMELIWAVSQNCNTLSCLVPFIDFDQSETFVLKMKLLHTGDFDMSAKATSMDFDPILADNVDSTNNGGEVLDLPNDIIFEDGFEDGLEAN